MPECQPWQPCVQREPFLGRENSPRLQPGSPLSDGAAPALPFPAGLRGRRPGGMLQGRRPPPFPCSPGSGGGAVCEKTRLAASTEPRSRQAEGKPRPRWGAGRARARSRGRGELEAGQVLSCGENNIN